MTRKLKSQVFGGGPVTAVVLLQRTLHWHKTTLKYSEH
jgi:hypothetical protein